MPVFPVAPSLPSRFSGLSLRWILIVPCLLQTVGAVGLVGYLSYQSGQRAVDHLAQHLLTQTHGRTSDRLDAYLQAPYRLVAINRSGLESGQLNAKDSEQLQHHFWRQSTLNSSVSSIGFGQANGEFIAVGVDHEQGLRPSSALLLGKVQQSTPGLRTDYLLDSKGNRVRVVRQVPNYDPRQRPWYQIAQRVRQQTWTPIYPYQTLPVASLFVVAPVYRNGQFQGVLFSDLLLSHISYFLSQLNVLSASQTFIVERSGDLVATSNLEPVFVYHNKTRALSRLPAINSTNLRTRLAMQRVLRQWPSLGQIRESQQIRFVVDRQLQYLQISPYQNPHGLDWFIVTVTPESAFMTEIQANTSQTITICLLTVLVATGLGLLTVRWVTLPLLRLTQVAQEIAKGNLEQPIPVGGVGEVRQLSESFRQMATQLQSSFQALQTSEQTWSKLLDHVPIGISVFDAQGHVVLLNQAGQKILKQSLAPGLSVESVVQTLRIYVAGTDDPYPVQQLPAVQALQGKATFLRDIEVEVTGERILLEALTIPVLSDEGSVLYAINAFQDVTERFQAEQLQTSYAQELERQVAQQTGALRHSEERLQLVIAASLDGIWDWQIDEQRAWWSSRVYELLGLPPGDVEDSYPRVLDLIHPDDQAHFEQALWAHLEAKIPYALEVRVRRADGQYGWFMCKGQALWRADGSPYRMVGSFSDISDRKRVEEALRESEARNRAIIAAIPDIIVLASADEICLSLVRTNSLKSLIPEHIDPVGKSFRELLPPDVALRQRQAVQRALQTHEPQVYEQQIWVHRRLQHEEVRVVATEDNTALILVRDISARKQAESFLRESEERFRRAFDDAPIGMALVSLDGRFLKVNHSLCEIVGYSERELLDKTFQTLTYPDDLDLDLNQVQQVLAGITRTYQIEKRYIHKYGHTVWVLLNVSLVRNQAGTPLYFVSQVQDVSERRAIDRMKDEFISIISHELRTPLTAIRGSLGILATGVLEPEPDTTQQMLQIALNNSERLVRLVNDILDLERLESGKVELIRESCDVTNLMQQAVELVQPIADQVPVTVTITALSATVWAAPDAIVQTLTNLLTNAIKFSAAGDMIELKAVIVTTLPNPSSLPLPHIRFSVADQGRGIPPQKLSAIFERFQQVDVSDSRRRGGTGLGLAICKRIVQQHGGDIWAESEMGKGSTFYFTLPIMPQSV